MIQWSQQYQRLKVVFMRILPHIGEAAAEVGGKTYLVRPSFRALSTIDDLEDEISSVCAAYNLLLSGVADLQLRYSAESLLRIA